MLFGIDSFMRSHSIALTPETLGLFDQPLGSPRISPLRIHS